MKRINQRAFTLIELLIALFILSVVLLALSTMVYSVMRATAQSKGMATATTLAQDKIESFKNLSYSSLTLGTFSEPITPSGSSITYTRKWTVELPVIGMNIKTIKVEVEWTDRLPHNVSITTVRGE